LKRGPIYLVLCPPWADPAVPPMGVSCLSEHLNQSGEEVVLFDLNGELYRLLKQSPEDAEILCRQFNRPSVGKFWEFDAFPLWPDGFWRATESLWGEVVRSWIEDVGSAKPDLIGFSIYGDNLYPSVELAKKAKEVCPSAKIAFGGPSYYFLLSEMELFGTTVDAIHQGEGEMAITRMLERIRSGRHFAEIGGTDWWDKGSLRTAQRPVEYLPADQLPLPRFRQLSLNLYDRTRTQIMLSRGCPHCCSFCNDRALLGPYRHVSLNGALDYLEWMAEIGYRELQFNDLNINANPSFLLKLCRGIVDRALSLKWNAEASFFGMTEELIDRMAEAGCWNLVWGLESGSPKMLELMNKKIDLDRARDLLRHAHRAGIRVLINLIAGHPGETDEDIEKTLRFVESVRDSIDGASTVNSLSVVPKSTLWNRAGEYGIRFLDPFSPLLWETSDQPVSKRLHSLSRLLDGLKRMNINWKGTDYNRLHSLNERTTRPLQRITKGPVTAVFRQNGLELSFRGIPITVLPGFYFDVDILGQRYHSPKAAWQMQGDGSPIEATWPGAPITAFLRMQQQDDRLLLRLSIRSKNEVAASRIKSGLILSDEYAAWKIEEVEDSFPPSSAFSGKYWLVVGPEGSPGPLRKGFRFPWNSGILSVVPKKESSLPIAKIKFLGILDHPVIQAHCPGVALSAYKLGDIALSTEEMEIVSMHIRLRNV